MDFLENCREKRQALERSHGELLKHHNQITLFLENLFREQHFRQGHLVLQPTNCFVERDIILPQLDLYREKLERQGVTVGKPLNLYEQKFPLMVDVGLRSQVYANLFSNAVKYTREIIDHQGRPRKAVAYGAEEVADFPETGRKGIKFNVFTTGPNLSEAESLLEQHGVHHTIVAFGSTRIREPESIRRELTHIRAGLLANPDNDALNHRLAVSERLLAKSRYYEVAREFGRLVGLAGSGSTDNRVLLITGGGPGIMEAANRGTFDVDSKSVGLNITLPHEQYPNPYITPELCFHFRYFGIRKLHFLLRARALVAFPGGFGTFDELFETLTLIQTRKIAPLPVVLVGEEFWRGAFDVDFLAAEGVIDSEDRELFWYAETAEEIWQGLHNWYEALGESFLPALD